MVTRSALLATVAFVAIVAQPVWAQTPAPATQPEVKAVEKPAKSLIKDYPILKVNGETIMFSEVQTAWDNFFPNGAAPDFNTFDEKVRQAILREVISKHLVYAQAVKKGVDKSEEVKKRLAQLQRQVIIQAYVESKTKGLVTDEKLREAYDAKVKALSDKEEIRARHILVANESDAKDIIKRLNAGEKFEDLAKEKSTDKASAVSGGDLDYFTEEKMVPEFGKAAFAMKVGEVSQPVKSAFGWHIIKVEDRRKIQPPGFDKMKAALVEEIANDAVGKLLNELMIGSDVIYYGPDGKEKPFSKVVDKSNP